MTPEARAFAALWKRRWASRPGGYALRLPNSPAYPLARTVGMPDGHAYPTAALSFRVTDLSLHGLDHLTGCTGEPGRVRLTLENLTLQGRYALLVKPDPVIGLDTGGNLADLPPESARPLPAGADSSPESTSPQKEEWLDQARAQRSYLQKTANGQKLLAFYSEHNETFDYVFRNNPALLPLWRAGGATSQMAGDTSAALKADGVINQKAKKYAGGLTYNANAFVQQLNVASACVWTDPDFDPMTGPKPGSKFWAAAKAALSFGKGVSTTTNNSKSAVTEMKPSQVHSTVASSNKDLPAVSDKEMATVIAMGVQPGGAPPEAVPDWLCVDEEDRRRLRALYEATMKHRAESEALTGAPLYEGSVTGRIDRVEAVVTAAGVELDLPAFDLNLDDSAWAGDVAAVARQRLEAVHFIRSLLHDTLAGGLKQAIAEASALTEEGAHGGQAVPFPVQ